MQCLLTHVFVACVASQLLVALNEARLRSRREAGLDAGARKRNKLAQLGSRVGLRGADTAGETNVISLKESTVHATDAGSTIAE
jgi:hypothetical protein